MLEIRRQKFNRRTKLCHLVFRTGKQIVLCLQYFSRSVVLLGRRVLKICNSISFGGIQR
jgi:hypothetical protein